MLGLRQRSRETQKGMNMERRERVGNDYRDGMTVDEIAAALSSKTFDDAATLPPSVSKETFDKTASELAKLKRENTELKNAGLSDAEKLQKALADAEAERKSYTLKSNRLEAEKIFAEAGISEKEYSSFVDTIVGEDSAASVSAAKAIAKMVSAQREAAGAAKQKEILDKTPKGGEHTETKMTLDEFRKLSPSERYQFSQKNPEEYKSLYSGGINNG